LTGRVSVALAAAGLCAAALVACDDDAPGTTGAGAGRGGVEPCLESPLELPRPPRNGLPCELLPPGFSGQGVGQ
jgi:hypothetical protein